MAFVSEKGDGGQIASGTGPVQVYEHAVIDGGRLVVRQEAIFRCEFDNEFRPRACSVQLGAVAPMSLQLLWAQHAGPVDAYTRSRDLKTDYKKLLAEHTKHVWGFEEKSFAK